MKNMCDHIHFIEEEIPFNKHLGLKVDQVGERFAALRLPFQPHFVGDARRPALHGGVISTLIDTCGGLALWTCCSTNDAIATIDLRVDYLRPAPMDDLIAEGTVKLLGNRVGNVQIIVYASKERDAVVAEGRAVYNIRRKEPGKDGKA